MFFANLLTGVVCRPVQHGQPSFHRSVSQPVDMDLTGLASFPGGNAAMWAGGSSNVGPPAGRSAVFQYTDRLKWYKNK